MGTKTIYVVHNGHREHTGDTACDIGYGRKWSKAASAYMEKNGPHFTPELAEWASKKMKNVDGTEHSWKVRQVEEAMAAMGVPEGAHMGGLTYAANMAYADFYPAVLKTEGACLEYAKALASDPDGYEGMVMYRFLTDMEGLGVEVPWERFV